MIKILSIGNSFSQDAQRYIHYLAKTEGEDIMTVNLYIGGCTIEHHFRNMMGNKNEYTLEVNGTSTNFKVSIEDALLSQSWDYVTIQQASSSSWNFDTYVPYLNELADFIRTLCPKAKLLIHQTWGYEDGSVRVQNMGFETFNEMFAKVEEAYNKAAKEIEADGIIPSGEVFKAALKNGIGKVHRDTFHASFGAGRFMLALTWYKYLTGNSIDNVSFNMFDEEVTEEEYKIAVKSVDEVL